MCSILGIGLLKGHTITDYKVIRTLLDELLHVSQDRGRHSTGILLNTTKGFNLLKCAVSANSFIKMKQYDTLMDENMYWKDQLLSIIGHCRFPTKGSEKINENNHPIVAKNIVGVHNGTITNDDELFDEFARFVGKDYWKRSGQVDSEIIFRLIDYYAYKQLRPVRDSIKLTSVNITGGYACAVLSTRNKNSIWLFRNHNPIFLRLFPKVGMVVFASSDNYIDRAVKDLDLGREIKIPIEENSGMEIDLNRNVNIPFKIGIRR